MLLRISWKKFNKTLSIMENQKLPSTLRRCFFIGLGFGTGLAIAFYIVKRFKLTRNNSSRELVLLALNDISHEIRELRGSVLVRFEKTTSSETSTSNERAGKVYRGKSAGHEVTTKTEYLAAVEGSSEDDDFFDLLDDDEQISSKESYQERGLLNTSKLIKECDELAEETDITNNDKELRILEDLLARNPNNVEVLWRYARAYKNKASFLSETEDQEEKKTTIYKGMKFVDKAIELDENNGDAHKWYAILLGITTEYEPLKEKIALGYKYKKHISKAIELKPSDPTVFHLMGRWSFEVATLSWWQRQAAATFIANPPNSSIDEALSNFNQAEKLSPGFYISNSLYIGKCYQNLGNMSKAKEWIKKSLDLPVNNSEDQKAHDEATTILASM